MTEEINSNEKKDGPITDVGKKFAGARKDNPSPDFSGNMNGIKSGSLVTKKEYWQKPDFRADAQSGHKPVKHALLFSLVYANLTNKPLGGGWFSIGQKQWDDAYIATLHFLKNKYESSHYERLEQLTDDFNAYMTVKFGAGRSEKDILERYSAGRHTNRRVKHPLSFSSDTRLRLKNLIPLGWPDDRVLDTDNYGAKKLLNTETGQHKWYAVKSISAKRFQTLDDWTEYDTFNAALEKVKTFFQPILDERVIEPKKGRAKPPKRPRYDRVEVREGKDHRKGENIDSQLLMDYFKFSGVEFGNWVNQKERAWFLNCTYDSLMDLVELLGLPVTFASLGGKLGIAFGSRGTGVDSAAAHFEPGNMLIHLTKTQGVGALAHEFAHGFDCVLAKRNGLNNNFFSEYFLYTSKGRYSVQNHQESAYKHLKDGQTADKFIKLVNYLTFKSTKYLDYEERQGGTGFMNNAMHLDQSRSMYWSQPTEIFARLFECWVTDKLAENDQQNGFLVHGTEESANSWNMKLSAYPTGRERAILVDLMDNWLKALVRSWTK
ncbi:LPD1 domain-containing protein (plasmid) [Acinetobacter soli]|uniref:LPD1 domain-containing protein n=1 Tax=Acinetobacter soli TaxID=487316 RepID=UPI004055BA57